MIHTLTLNPAVDRILYLNQFEKNITNRIRKKLDTIGGKGTHVSVDLSVLREPSTAFGICHGDTGRRVIGMLSDYGIDVQFDLYEDGRETRTNYLIIEDSSDCTIISEKGVALEEDELEALLVRMDRLICPGDYLLFSGDASNSPDPSVYSRILDRFRDRDVRFVLDTSGESLRECIRHRPLMVKPNLDELSMLAGWQVPEEDAEICRAISQLEKWQVPIIAVTLGGGGSVIRAGGVTYRVRSPKVNVCNTIGCGDCFLAGFVCALSRGCSIEDTIRLAASVSSACAESDLSIGFDAERADALADQVEISVIGRE